MIFEPGSDLFAIKKIFRMPELVLFKSSFLIVFQNKVKTDLIGRSSLSRYHRNGASVFNGCWDVEQL